MRTYQTVRNITDYRPLFEQVAMACKTLKDIIASEGMQLVDELVWEILTNKIVCKANAMVPSEPEANEVRRLARNRWTVKQIAALTGIPEERVARFMPPRRKID